MTAWHLQPIYNLPLVVACGVLLLGMLMWFGSETQRLGSGRHWTLFALRLVVFLLIVLLMLRPTLVTTEKKEQTATIAVMVDDSRSMGQKDELNGTSRWQALKNDLDEVGPIFDELAQKYQLEFSTFDATTIPAGATIETLPLNKPPAGNQTAIGSALDDLLRRSSNKRLAAAILLSDGAQQALPPRDMAPQTPARRLGDLGTPLFTFCYGQERSLSQNRDAAVIELLSPPTVYVKNVLTVTGNIRATGLVNQPLEVKLLYETAPGKEEIVASTTLMASEDGQTLPVEMSFVPDQPGEHKLTLRADLPQGLSESVTTNNQLTSYVTVLAGGIAVLYLEGEQRVESRFLRRALNASPDMKVDFEWLDARRLIQERRTANLADKLKPGKYNCYILGDLDSAVFRAEDLSQLAANVEAGTGLILLGGYHAYWPGGYQDTPLARVMPMQYDPNADRLSRQNYSDPLRQDLHLQGPLTIQPDAVLGRSVSFMQLAAPAENAATWAKLPPFKGANNWRLLKPAAKILARSQNGAPLIAALEPGAGRVVAMAGDSTWTWAMQGFDALHKTFWRQVVLWALKIDESQAGEVWVVLEQRRLMPGRRVAMTTGIRGGNPDVAKNSKFTATVTLPNKQQRTLSLVAQEDGLTQTGSFGETTEPGEYQVVINAEHNGKNLGTAKARFVVLAQDLELDHPLARPSLLAGLAQMTSPAGGEALSRGQLRELLERLRDKPPQFEVETQVKHTPWDRPEVFLLIVTLMIAEWALRKKWGLV
jgi:hypothetical protein